MEKMLGGTLAPIAHLPQIPLRENQCCVLQDQGPGEVCGPSTSGTVREGSLRLSTGRCTGPHGEYRPSVVPRQFD